MMMMMMMMVMMMMMTIVMMMMMMAWSDVKVDNRPMVVGEVGGKTIDVDPPVAGGGQGNN